MTTTTPVPAAQTHAVRSTARSHWAPELLRIALGFMFLWPFLDKLFGLGYATPGAKSWLNGGSPTKGFLSHVAVGPFQGMFHAIAGNFFINILFMAALLGVGVAMLLGVALRPAAISGSILLVMMWAAEWPMAKFTSAGDPTSSTNPLIDTHIIMALGLIVVAVLGSSMWSLGNWWAKQHIVIENPVLR